MFGFFKQWSENAAEYKALQNELTIIFARHGVNFMHLHPEVGKCLVGLARTEGSEYAVECINNLMEKIASESPSMSQSDQSQVLLYACRTLYPGLR